jgi:hypothetical protein
MIIFDKFGDGQSERNHSVPVFPNSAMRTVTPVSPLCLLALTMEEAKERHPSRMSERLSLAALVGPPTVSMRGRIAVSVCAPTFAHHGTRLAISNRELDLLERRLSHCKQRKATVSNRELSTVCDAPNIVNLVRFSISKSPSRAPISDANFRWLTTFLPGSGRKVEVTEKKRLNPVYPALEMHINAVQFRAEFRTESKALREKECPSRDAAEQGKLPLTIRNEKELL